MASQDASGSNNGERQGQGGQRLWMAGLWIFFCTVFLGANLWKVPGYAELYKGLGLPLPPLTRGLIAVATFCSRFWVAAAIVLALPIVPIATGRLDGRAAKFTVILILLTMAAIAVYTVYLPFPAGAFDRRFPASPATSP